MHFKLSINLVKEIQELALIPGIKYLRNIGNSIGFTPSLFIAKDIVTKIKNEDYSLSEHGQKVYVTLDYKRQTK